MKDQLKTIREAQPPFGFVRMNPGFNSGVFHQGAECQPGWPGAIAVYHAAPVAQQPQATCITITHAQAAELMLMFSDAEPDTEITLLTGDGHSGPGLYAYYEEYPEEGAEKLDATELPAQQPQAEAITEAAIDAYLDDYEMRGETEDGRDACYTPSEREKFLIKDAIMGLLAEAPLKQPQAEALGYTKENWIDAAMRVYRVAGDTEDVALDCAKALAREQDWASAHDDLSDPYEAALEDVEGRRAAPQQAEAVPDVRNLISQLENAAHNKGELFERHQGKGWPATASERFTRLRDETIPALRKQLLAAIAQQKGGA